MGETIKRLLKQKKRTQKWLAEQIGTSSSTMSEMLNGQKKLTEKQKKAVAAALGVTVEQLEYEKRKLRMK